MKYFLPIFFLVVVGVLSAQTQIVGSVLGSAGQRAENTAWQLNFTLGEAAIFSSQNSQNYYGQGFQTIPTDRLTSLLENEEGLGFAVTLYPNPSYGLLQVATEAEISHFRWFSSDGRLAGQALNRANRVDLGKAAAGLYLIQAQINGQYHSLGRVIRLEGQ